jgi:hypothetical protein
MFGCTVCFSVIHCYFHNNVICYNYGNKKKKPAKKRSHPVHQIILACVCYFDSGVNFYRVKGKGVVE